MKRLINLILINVTIWNLVAQNTDITRNDSIIVQSFEAKICSSIINPKSNFNKMCWPEDWNLSSIVLYNNDLITNKNLIYNGYENSFICFEPSEMWISRLESDLVKEVKMSSVKNSDTLLFRKMKLKQGLNVDSTDIFFNVMIEGKISLYVYRKTIWDDYSKNYVHDFQYYLKKQDQKLQRFKPKKSSLLAQFPEKKKELKHIIKKNKLWIRDEPDLVKAISLLNSVI